MALVDRIFAIQSAADFDKACLEVFEWQATECPVYAAFLSYLGVNLKDVTSVGNIPFLPIEFFKNHRITSSSLPNQMVFYSSGTTGSVQSKHYLVDSSVYERSFRLTFNQFYGTPKNMAILALLPSYAERDGSSLIYMVDDLIHQSDHSSSGYFLYNHAELFNTLQRLKTSGIKTLLLGVTYALLDFVERYTIDFPELLVMETGGMKGKRQEMIREEVHNILQEGFNVPHIHSEYGMTELLSQAYSSGNGIFRGPPWMEISIRDINDPLSKLAAGRTGAINIIDLANIYSCAFIATQDLGRLHDDNAFEVLGRFDQSDIRGCNLLVQ